MRRTLPTLLLSTLGLLVPALVSPAAATPRRSATEPRAARDKGKPPARSIGSPTEGKLEGAVELLASPEIRLRHANGARFGLPGLVGLLERSSKRVASRFPGTTLHVGDLSRRDGGEIAGHASHESGRDADVAFLFVGPDGKSVSPNEFLTVNDQGRAVENQAYRFDEARNWALVEAWVTDPGRRVEHIFVADRLRARLLGFARTKGTYLPVLHRAAIAMKQPSAAQPHDDHFHIRISCPPGQRRVCVPTPTGAAKPPRVARPTREASIRRVSPPVRGLVKPKKERETTRR
jgi:penicillin-insensitive murein endopeptidase